MTATPHAVSLWPIDRLRPNPLNPRGPVTPDDPAIVELADSIRVQGLLQALLVTPDGLVVAGHRRLEAARLAGLTEIPVTVRPLNEREQLELMLVENMQRQALTLLQEARAFKTLIDQGMNRADVARRVGITKVKLDSRLVILKLAPDVQGYFDRAELPISLAAVLATIPEPDRQRRFAQMAAERGLTAKQIEQLVERGQSLQAAGGGAGGAPPAPASAPAGPDRDMAVKLLTREPARAVSFARLYSILEALCCACGTNEARPELCRQCPIPKLVTLVAKEPVRARA